MGWRVQIADEFEPELSDLPLEVRRAILAHSRVLREYGPQLGRPRVDTLNGSRHANMKEMRFSAAGGEWRVAFAFDPVRRAMLLVAGDKSGGSERRFYSELIPRPTSGSTGTLPGSPTDREGGSSWRWMLRT